MLVTNLIVINYPKPTLGVNALTIFKASLSLLKSNGRDHLCQPSHPLAESPSLVLDN
jgi:hypothetical protein